MLLCFAAVLLALLLYSLTKWTTKYQTMVTMI
jgi:hypothetical protein